MGIDIKGLLTRLGTGVNNLGQGISELQGDPMFNMGVGLLAAGGRRPGQRISFGQGLLEASDYASKKEADFQKLEANRMALQQAAQQRKAQQGIVGLLNNPAASVPAAIRRPGAIQDEQTQMMGLLAQANPQGFTQAMTESLLAPSPNLPSSILETIAATGLNPGDPGFQEAFTRIQNPNAESERLAAGINLRLAEENLLTAADDRAARETAVRQSNTSLRKTVREIKSLVTNIRDTLGTNVEVGSLAASFIDGDEDGSKIAEAIITRFGNSPEEARQLATKYQAMFKGFGRLLNVQIPEGATNFAQQRLIASNPNVNLTPGANSKFLSEALDDAIAQDIDQDGEFNVLNQQDIDEIRAIIKEIDKFEAAGGRPAGPNVPAPPPGYE